ncbi:MAG: ABC transporter permease, partial [bacterium]
ERFRAFYMLNPMAVIIESYRDVLVKGVMPADFQNLCVAFVVSVLVFVAGYRVFKSVERWFADTI